LTIDYQYVSSQGPDKRLPAPVEIGLYRIALEALSNVISHASATRASVIVLWQDAQVRLLVEDDGRGFDYSATRKDIDHCLGLIGMEERMALMGGTLNIESMPKRGTTVRAEIQIKSPPLKFKTNQ
jgi:signal transduction histidine kinase